MKDLFIFFGGFLVGAFVEIIVLLIIAHSDLPGFDDEEW